MSSWHFRCFCLLRILNKHLFLHLFFCSPTYCYPVFLIASMKQKIVPLSTSDLLNTNGDGIVADKSGRTSYATTAEAIQAANPFGRYQIYTCLVIGYAQIMGAGLSGFWSFASTIPLYKCNEPYNYTLENIQDAEYQCDMVNYCTNRSIAFSRFHSIAHDFMLICDQKVHWDLIMTLHSVGHIVGSLMGGHLSDYFGRKVALYPSLYGVCIVSTLSAACTSWESFAVCATLIGFIFGNSEVAAFPLVVEMVDTKHRWIVVCCFQWPIQYAIAALIGYLTADWRLYLIMINVLLAPLLIFFLIFVESPRYLIYHEQFDRAAKALEDISSERWNRTGLTFEESDLRGIDTTRKMDPKYPTIIELFRGWKKARLSMVLSLGMLTRSIASNVFLQSSSWGPDNPFLNIALYGLSRIWVPILIVFADRKFERFGRRAIFLSAFIVIGLCSLILEIMFRLQLVQNVWFLILGLGAGGISASAGWMSLVIVMVEAFPTAIRGIGYSWMIAIDGLGGLISSLGLRNQQWWIYIVFMIVPCFITVITGYFWVPETKGHELEDGLHTIKTSSAKKRSQQLLCRRKVENGGVN